MTTTKAAIIMLIIHSSLKVKMHISNIKIVEILNFIGANLTFICPYTPTALSEKIVKWLKNIASEAPMAPTCGISKIFNTTFMAAPMAAVKVLNLGFLNTVYILEAKELKQENTEPRSRKGIKCHPE